MNSASFNDRQQILSVTNIHVAFNSHKVLKGLNLDVYRGEILGFVGGSGTGKSVLTRTILGLNQKQQGEIKLFGIDYDQADDRTRIALDQRMGVLFQHGALFSSLTVKENIQVPMREYLTLNQALMDELAAVKIKLVGLPPEAGDKYPSELSGGMVKRAALARALALDPDLLFLDEPTSGLDPIGAEEFDDLIVSLRNSLGLTVFMVTHDLDSLKATTDRIAVLRGGKILLSGTMDTMATVDDEWVQAYFQGKRACGIN